MARETIALRGDMLAIFDLPNGKPTWRSRPNDSWRRYMRPVSAIHEAGGDLSTATEYLDLMAFKRTSFRFQVHQKYRVSSEKAAFKEFREKGAFEVTPDDPRLARQRQQLSGGRVLQRVQVVVPPVSSYLRFSFAYFDHFARAGEDLRILDASKVPLDGLPNYDFVLLDDEVVVKLRHRDGYAIGRELLTNVDIGHFRAYRDLALSAAVPFAEYQAQVMG
ncbi:DUF6879 family protein [Amycolatopsis sp. NPDC049868]|uniref:DUF6879 family protein n=1 Tax=Amycolatopsis sp. NPDC049868 TaxID=3363934 RepID=UPI00379B0152